MAKKHSFAKGVATGVIGTAATVAGAVFAVKKTIIEPEEKKLAFIEENRKKAARRRVSRFLLSLRLFIKTFKRTCKANSKNASHLSQPFIKK